MNEISILFCYKQQPVFEALGVQAYSEPYSPSEIKYEDYLRSDKNSVNCQLCVYL